MVEWAKLIYQIIDTMSLSAEGSRENARVLLLMKNKLKIIAIDKDNNVEIFKHKKKNIYGFMWHPERNNTYKDLNKIINRLKIK